MAEFGRSLHSESSVCVSLSTLNITQLINIWGKLCKIFDIYLSDLEMIHDDDNYYDDETMMLI